MNLNQLSLNKKKNLGVRRIPIANTRKPPVTNKHVSTPSTSTRWGKTHISVGNSSTSPQSAGTTVSDNEHGRRILSLTEGRGDARCEVGIAFIDTTLPTLILCQISDLHSYINTLTKINILNPSEILVPATFIEQNNRLVNKIRQQFPDIKVIGVPRKTFHKTNGMERILELCLPSINTICIGLQYRYYALAASSALLMYLHKNLNIYYTNGTINVVYQESEGFAIIDISTADRLELVSCLKPAQADAKKSTLYGILNYCYTKIGARTLRSTILQPLYHQHLIEERLNCVNELIKHPEKLLQIQEILQKLKNIDQLLSITTIMCYQPQNASIRQLNYLLLLNNLIDLIQPLYDVLKKCRQHFFIEIAENLQNDGIFLIIKEKLQNLLVSTAQPAKGEDGILQRCFAIKPGLNALLDLVRKVYSERLDDMIEYVKMLSNKYKLPLVLSNNNTKGYHIVLKLNKQQKKCMNKSDLPQEFIQVYRLAGSFTMKTVDLINLSTRLEDILMQILRISNLMINNTIKEINGYVGCFYKFCEDIAKLDVLQSLAQAAINNNYTRPRFNKFTELTHARHPLLEQLCSDGLIDNPISISKDYNVQIITGPNGSGKSIYLRQVMLLQIMAQIGSYVPAHSATFRPTDRMFARIYLEDDMEWGASAFTLEIKEIQYMLTVMTDNSLFILDEPCRSTCLEEGTALAMAICERFCKTSTFLLICTHYTLLTKLSDLYLNVKIWQMESLSNGDNQEDLTLQFKYKLIPGVTPLKRYALALTKNLWPNFLLRKIYRILNQLEDGQTGSFARIDERVRLKYELESHFRKLKERGKLTRSEINKYLNRYRDQLKINENTQLKLQITTTVTNLDEESRIVSKTNETVNSNHQQQIEVTCDNIKNLIPEVILNSTQGEVVLNSSNHGTDKELDENCSQDPFYQEDLYNLNDGSVISTQDQSVSYSPLYSPGPSVISGTPPEIDGNLTNISQNRCLDATSAKISTIVNNDNNNNNGNEKGTSSGTGVTKTNSSTVIMKNLNEFPESSTNSSANKLLKKRKMIKELTRREIEEEFHEQDLKIQQTNSEDYQKYLEHILKRPSIRQIKQTEHLAYVRKTDEGNIEVIPTKKRPNIKKKLPIRQIRSNSNIDVTIFSDRNANTFEEFLNSNQKNLNLFSFNLERNTPLPSTNPFNFQPNLNQNTSINSYSNDENDEIFLTPANYFPDDNNNDQNIYGNSSSFQF